MPAISGEQVALVRCNRYEPGEVRSALEEIFAFHGGIEAVVGSGKKVLLKPNLLSAVAPSKTVTTNPLIVKVVAEMIQEAGGKVFIGDSPGHDNQEKAHRICGLQEVIEATGAEPLYFSDPVYKQVEGYRLWEIPLAPELSRVDLVINLAKLKTHSFTGMTAAVKNVYGCVPGKHKARFHFEHPLPKDFSRLLLDVYYAVRPAFSIIDAVVAMEGAGPRNGRPRQVGLLIGGMNALALDVVAASVLGFQPEQVTTNAEARKLRLEGSDLESIIIKGKELEEVRLAGFDLGPVSKGRIGRLLALLPFARIRDFMTARRPYPRINPDLCSGCGVCQQSCPARAIEFCGSIPDIDYHGCIRCYCCQEFCGQGAVELSGSRSGN